MPDANLASRVHHGPMHAHPSGVHRLDPSRLGRYTDALYRAAWAMCGSSHDAEDLVQETFANVLAQPRLVRGSELGYLLRALRNAYADRRRAAARRPVTVELREDDVVPTADAGAGPDGRAVLKAIAAAPPQFRDAVIAVDLLGLSYAEAARHLGAPEDTVASRVYRGRAHVARRLTREGLVRLPRTRGTTNRGVVSVATSGGAAVCGSLT
jgi:RNA polymerase sigma-70 factor (ECF subfamily)